MGSSQNYNLKWEEYQSNIQSCYSQLGKTNHFSDVTLVGEGGDQIKAHRVVLASTSPVFEDILRKNEHPQPLIYMRGIKCLQLKLLMTYIYQGEVEVSTDDFNDFLAVAGELKVKGLTTNDTLDTSLEKYTCKNSYSKEQEHNTLLEEQVVYKTNKRDETQPLLKPKALSDTMYHKETQDIWNSQDSKSNVLTKVETTYSCNFCGKPSITKIGLVKHKSRYHSAIKYKNFNASAAFECKICGRKSISKGGLLKHSIRHHTNMKEVV